MIKLKTFNVKIGDLCRGDVDLSFGIYFSTREKIKIDIFSIDVYIFDHFINNAPTICQKIINIFSPGKLVHDIEWTYTAGPVCSMLEFEAVSGLAVTMRFGNGEVAENYCGGRPIDQYAKALNDPRGLQVALQDGFPDHLTFTSEPIIRYLAHTPRRSLKIHVLEHPYRNGHFEDYPVVLVDTKKLLRYWRQQCNYTGFQKIKNLYRKKVNSIDDDDRKLLKSSYETSSKYPIPHEMACGVCLNFENKICFTNGRHRTVNLANAGAPFIPVHTCKEGISRFRKLFEWEPAKNYNLISR